jgi:hypothetical protein
MRPPLVKISMRKEMKKKRKRRKPKMESLMV